MRIPVRVILCGLLLAPFVVRAQSGPTEPYYHWPEYPPFSPGSWAWPMAGWWEFAPLPQNYPSAPQAAAPPPTIIVFAQLAPSQNLAARQPSAPAAAAVPPKSPAASPAPPQASPLYLIALKDGVIRPAVSYRVEDTVLHYMDLGGAPQQVPLDRVDRALSAELNRQRRVPFRLPPEP